VALAMRVGFILVIGGRAMGGLIWVSAFAERSLLGLGIAVAQVIVVDGLLDFRGGREVFV
jgi:hypothetical protein